MTKIKINSNNYRLGAVIRKQQKTSSKFDHVSADLIAERKQIHNEERTRRAKAQKSKMSESIWEFLAILLGV